MKTLLIITLTSALLSFNSVANTSSEIRVAASNMVKANILEMNSQFTRAIKHDFKGTINIPTEIDTSTTSTLLAKVANKHSDQPKLTIKAADE